MGERGEFRTGIGRGIRVIHNGFIYFYSVTATDHALLPESNRTGSTSRWAPAW